MSRSRVSKKEQREMAAAAAAFVEETDFDRAGPHEPIKNPSLAISLRVPEKLLLLIKRFAAREEVGYQVLMKQWLEDRLRQEVLMHRKGDVLGEFMRQLEELMERANDARLVAASRALSEDASRDEHGGDDVFVESEPATEVQEAQAAYVTTKT